MMWTKRILLFLATNILVMLTISILVQLLGLNRGLGAYGIDYGQLMLFCLVWGMGGSLISLALSRVMAKMMMGVRLIDPATSDPRERALLDTVHALARGARLPAMPEVGYYNSPEVNAFATGPTRSRALVAVSSGLLQRMNGDEVEGVLGHEISHIANGDMVTMTLIQGVVNAFVLYLSHLVAMLVRNVIARDNERGPSMLGMLASQIVFFAAQIAFGLIGSMITAWFSRQREFRADAGGAGLAGRGAMISALRRLELSQGRVDNVRGPELATLKIAGGSRFVSLLSTHPPLQVRIAALEGRS